LGSPTTAAATVTLLKWSFCHTLPAEPPVNDASTDTLTAALARHSLELPPPVVEQLERYVALLWEWNAKLNLTRHTDYEKFVSRDLVDSLELAKLLHPEEEVLDVGTGGGVPGVLLALVRPDLKVTLCESVGKKAQAVQDIVERGQFPAAVYHCRAEDLFEDFRFDAVVARAVGPLPKFCVWFKDHWASIGRLLLIKGPNWTDERREAREKGMLNDLQLRVAASYPMPGTHAESVILKVWPKHATEK
jgi:16S rRNA (guanine527-N7)-methyltransferase